MADNRKLCIGKIVGAQGLRGYVRVCSFTDDPNSLFDYAPVTDETGKRTFVLSCVGARKDCFIASVKGISDRTAAEGLRGETLFVDRSLLPKAEEGSYYEADLMGLRVQSDDPKAEGEVVALHDYGAGAFLEIKVSGGASYMLPFKDAFVPVVDLDQGFVRVTLPEGWLTTNKADEKNEEEEA